MMDRLLTPSKITAWLDCAHFLSLKHEVEDGRRDPPAGSFGSFARLLADKGLQHEDDCLAEYKRHGKKVEMISERETGESFASWVERVGNPLSDSHDVIYQMPFIHDGVRGIADFLVRVVDESGAVSYEPVDAKLARFEAKPGHVLQLCFYADAIEALTGTRPKQMHLWLGSGEVETLTVSEFRPYWNRLRLQLANVLDAPQGTATTVPELCNHCAFCEFFDTCTEEWRDQDSLIYVAGLRSPDRALLEIAGISTLESLAMRTAGVDGVRPERLARLTDQAALQVAARLLTDSEPPPFSMIERSEDPPWGHGLELLPEPNDGDVFLDFEGHPFWRADRGLFFLFGLIERDAGGDWNYRAWWAENPGQEAVAAASLIDYLEGRRAAFSDMHVYHYNHTERSSLERLAADHGVREVTLRALIEAGLFVDLLVVARNTMQVGSESYGLKSLERLTSFERGHDIDAGAGAVVEYEQYMADGESAHLDSIASYNEDDVRATRALRDWLVDHRPDGLPWRDAVIPLDDAIVELDEQAAALHAFGAGTPEHLLGDVLGYWRREWLAHLGPLLASCQAEVATLLDEPEALAGLRHIAGPYPRFGKNEKPLKNVGMRFAFPGQAVDGFAADGGQVVFVGSDGVPGYSSIDHLDLEAGEVDLVWSEENVESGVIPSAVLLNDWVSPNPKPAAVSALASRVLDPTGPAPNPVTMALLRRDLPKFESGFGPAGGQFSDDLEQMTAWATGLDRSYVAIQGPPGTGKTYRAAHLVRTLILAGKRVGITAMSHHAIDNLLEEVITVMTEAGGVEQLNVARRGVEPSGGGLRGVTYVGGNSPCARSEFNLVAGTTWLFAGPHMEVAPVDVLLIDEAGQLALADAIAASRSAHNLVLFGDPLQLKQVAQAVHASGSGDSVLEHVLGEDVTIPANRGVFLTETRRMHPDVCDFISNEIYEGRLHSHTSCALQDTTVGTGLRWIRAHHGARTTESEEEAEIVAAEISRLMGTVWTNHRGERQPLTSDDFMVVAPYNDQVDLIRTRLDQEELTRGVPVGTVDKFQGRQAAVVFFTMTTSTAADMTRSADFLFSRNRLNVAVSRARCLAYLVCTEELLNSRARDVREMRLLSTLCALVEQSEPWSPV